MTNDKLHKFFLDLPYQEKLFDLIRKYIISLGNVEIKVTKTQISFGRKRQFAWVWLPLPWDKKRPENCIILSFSLPQKVNHPLIVQTVEPYPGRFMHHVVIEKKEDLDDDVRKWLKDAYIFGDTSSNSSTA